MSERDRAIKRIRTRLERRASPRLHMMVLVALTAAVGLLASFSMLSAGLTSMEARYPLAVGIAYLAFLGLVGLWLRRFRLRARQRRDSGDADVDFDVTDVPFDNLFRSTPAPFEFGGGGGYSGAGGGSSWGEAVVVPRPAPVMAPEPRASGWCVDLDVDEGGIILVLLLIGALALSVVLYVVWTAPVLFAELLLDAGLAAGLYRRLSRIERRRWLFTAVRATLIPACIVALLLGAAGTLMQIRYPDAASIGPVIRHWQARRAHDAPG
jgi:hypothetical protein